MSVPRTQLVMRRAASTSTWSPRAWPSRSLTSLKWSRSRNSLADLVVQPLHEHVAVRQTREGVEIGLLPDQLAVFLVAGDVGHQRQRAHVAARRIEDRIGGQRGPYRVAVFMQEFEFPVRRRAVGALFDIVFQDGLALLVHEGRQRFAQHVLDRVAEHVGHARIDEGGAGDRVDLPDAFFGRVDDAAKALLAAFEGGQLAFGPLDHDPAGLAAAVGAGPQRDLKGVAAGALHLDQAARRLGGIQSGADEAVEIGQEGRRDEGAEAVLAGARAFDAEHLGAHQINLQDRAVEGDDKIADRRQQVEIVVVGLFFFIAQARQTDAAVERGSAARRCIGKYGPWAISERRTGKPRCRIRFLVHLTSHVSVRDAIGN
jgi:hypothetical protein